ncbi:hypothetical protein NW752_002319 [Fusarium irregulare]|uniref:Uncharacterized protein n=1 Tax=Fusarium irregulare TaxID=2494466 RepID=A0A9W8U600_9HYPO|nr:hypothetical protein NW766_011036 [Fusarium irregulare]KAJ4024866.1 hypothetical protein NW752_002319 [Fusarium irregulare]
MDCSDDISESHVGEFAENSPAFSVSLYLEGEASNLHTENDPNDPFERMNVIERHGRVGISCEHKHIVHGFYDDKDRQPCSLVVFDFSFTPNGPAVRIKEAYVVVKFSAMKKGDPEPVVQAAYPKGMFGVVPTTHRETSARSAGINVGGGSPFQVGAELKVENSIECETISHSTVKGSIDKRGRNWGDKNSVSWSLWENPKTKTGIVTSMQAPVLLRRRDMSQFKATMTIKIVADTMSQLGSVFKTDPKDDDVWYDPERKGPMNEFDVKNLGKLDLKSIAGVTFLNVFQNGIKEESLGS